MLTYPKFISSGEATRSLLDWFNPPSDLPSGTSSLQPPIQPNVMIGCSMLGGILLFARITPIAYDMLSLLQEAMEVWEFSRPLLGASYKRHRSQSAPASNVVDGDLITSFLRMCPGEQRRLVTSAAAEGLEKVVVKFLEEKKNGSKASVVSKIVDGCGEDMMAVDEIENGTQKISMSVERIVEVIEIALEELNEMMA